MTAGNGDAVKKSKSDPKMLINDAEGLKKRVISVFKRTPEPVIALSTVFELMGFPGLTGIGWGILSGIIVSVAIELGYEVRRVGGRYLLYRKGAIYGSNK